MKLYQTASGIYVGTQAEAKEGGEGWGPVEVPNSKPELIEWLNTNARNPIPARDNKNIVDASQGEAETVDIVEVVLQSRLK